jgi:hypothetical protein
MQAFPGTTVKTGAANSRDGWFLDFVDYLAKWDI